MKATWDRFVKWLAGRAFTWGLKMLTEKYGEGGERPMPRLHLHKPRHRKPYIQ